MKKYADAILFHTAICAGASQIALMAEEKRKSEFLFARRLRSGMEIKMAKQEEKTNVMRVLDSKKIPYKHYCYVDSDAVNGMEVAAVLNQNPDQVFKTLVTTGKTGAHYVFVIPVNKELNLKLAAKAVGEKSIEMLKSKDLLPLTGYIHGGCSPIGMKKAFTTVVDSSVSNFETIIFSAGKIGYQVEVALSDLQKVVRLSLHEVAGI